VVLVGAPALAFWRTLTILFGGSFILIIYIPVLWIAVMSFSGEPLSGSPGEFTLHWYRDLVTYPTWGEPLLLSLLLASATAITCMIVATAVGRIIPRLKRQGSVLIIALLPLFVPGLTMGAALFLFFRSYLALRLGVWSVFVGHVVWALPFSLLLVAIAAARFDDRLIEAALDLGASRWRAFWDIEMPHLLAGITGAGIFGFLLSFNELLRTLFLRGLSTTLPVYQWAQSSNHQTQVAVTFCLATLILAVAVPAVAVLFWILFVRLDTKGS
jgi:ABC-type spermidine/putrescine transport system permease subunit II